MGSQNYFNLFQKGRKESGSSNDDDDDYYKVIKIGEQGIIITLLPSPFAIVN
jgi:hypothetical protein